MICGSGGLKSRLAKAAGAMWSDERWKLHAIVARSTFPSQNAKGTPTSDHFSKLRCRRSAHRCGAKHISNSKGTKHTNAGPLFGSWDVEKVQAFVAWSTYPSQNVQSTPHSKHFWKLRCWKIARRCGVKHISKSKCRRRFRERFRFFLIMWLCLCMFVFATGSRSECVGGHILSLHHLA